MWNSQGQTLKRSNRKSRPANWVCWLFSFKHVYHFLSLKVQITNKGFLFVSKTACPEQFVRNLVRVVKWGGAQVLWSISTALHTITANSFIKGRPVLAAITKTYKSKKRAPLCSVFLVGYFSQTSCNRSNTFLFLFLRGLILLTQYLGSHGPEVCSLSSLFHLSANSSNVDVNTHNRCKMNLTLWDSPWRTEEICGKGGRWALVISVWLSFFFSSLYWGRLWTHLFQVIRKCLQCLISNKCLSTYHEEQCSRAM